MSLLMEALKRAEENKQGLTRAVDEPSASGVDLTLEPLANGETTSTPPHRPTLPDLATHIAAVDADLASAVHLRTARSPDPDVSTTARRETAQTVFAAKGPHTPSRAPLVLTLVILGIGAVAIGLYFWIQLNRLPSTNLLQPATAVAPALEVTKPTVLPALHGPQIADSTAPAESQTSPVPPRKSIRMAADEEPARPALHLTRSRPEVDPRLLSAWNHLQTGALDAARHDYEAAWQRDPQNVDAMLGLAAIAQKQGRTEEAEKLRQLALTADPKDAGAQAAQVDQLAAGDPLAAESRVKSMLAEQPRSAALNFALGNLLARQQRWPEAQQAYFNAVAAEGDHPDYLFNLAISLDHMQQPKLAAQYYRQALAAATSRPHAFAPDQVERRLRQLPPG